MWTIVETNLTGDMFNWENLSWDILSWDVTTENMLSWDITTGNILFGSGDTLLDSGVLDGNTGSIVSSETSTGDTHNVADNNTSLIPNTSLLPDTTTTTTTTAVATISIDEFKTQLESYSSQGKLTVLKAKKSNDKELTKNSLALYKKADASLQDIANGKEITTDDMNTILSELSWYLAKLTPTDASVPVTQSPTEQQAPIQETTPTNTWTSTFNPDAFFWTTGN